jgi:hypothetical protein
MVNKVKNFFIPSDKVPEGKDGNLIWCEEDPKGGLIWFSKPVSRKELSPDIVQKESPSSISCD